MYAFHCFFSPVRLSREPRRKYTARVGDRTFPRDLFETLWQVKKQLDTLKRARSKLPLKLVSMGSRDKNETDEKKQPKGTFVRLFILASFQPT